MEGQPGSPAASMGTGDALVQLQAQLQVQQDQRAEEERNMVLTLVTKKSDELIDSKGVGQPFKFREVRPGLPRVEPQIQDLPEGQVRR